MNGYLYWKDLGGILLNCLLAKEAKKTIKELHHGVCGGHHYWKETMNKILTTGFYWSTMLSNVYK